MSKRYYTAVEGTAGNVFRRMALDEANNTAEHANRILEFCHGKISEADYAKLERMLMGGEVGGEETPIELRRAGAMDSASFNARFPSAKRIGRDDMIGVRR